MNPSARNFETVDQTEERLAQPRVEQSAPTVVEAKTEEKSPSFWQKIRKNLFKSTAAVAVVGASFGAGHATGEMNVVEKPEVSQPVNSDNVLMQLENLPEKSPEVYITPAGPETYSTPNLGEVYATSPPLTPPIELELELEPKNPSEYISVQPSISSETPPITPPVESEAEVYTPGETNVNLDESGNITSYSTQIK